DAAVAAELREQAQGYLAAVEEHGWDGAWYRRGDARAGVAIRCESHAAVPDHGWDGAWYRRAYDDAGVPIGSSASEECRIDSIAQSWSVISGGGRPERRLQAMRSLEEHLVDREARLVR